MAGSGDVNDVALLARTVAMVARGNFISRGGSRCAVFLLPGRLGGMSSSFCVIGAMDWLKLRNGRFSAAVSWGCSMLLFSSLKMASTSSGESTGNAESTLPAGDDGISVMGVFNKSYRSGNVETIVVWKRDRQKKTKKWKNCVGKLKSAEKWWKCVKKSVM